MNLDEYFTNFSNNEILKCIYYSFSYNYELENNEKEEKNYKNKKDINFKIYISKNKIYSKILNENFIKEIDKFFRFNFLIKKYSKKWIDYFLNKKEPLNNTDLELNVIDTTKFHINYIDYSEKKRYIFTQNDFKKLVKNNLEHSYSYDMIPQPILIKNPYTNKEFKKEELLLFNYEMTIHNINMPLVWNMFVNCEYNITKLRSKHFYYLSEMCIPSFVEQMDDDDIIFYLKQIFLYFGINYCRKCIQEKIKIKSKKVTFIIIDWILSIKYYKNFNEDYFDKLSNIYSKEKCIHRPKIYINRIINNSFNISLDIDLSKPLFCVGYDENDENKENHKKLYKNKLRHKRNKKTYIKK